MLDGRGRLVAGGVAAALPLLLMGWGMTALADSPAPTGSGTSSSLPGDPSHGGQLFAAAGCVSCHGANLAGGVGPPLLPIQKLADASNPLDPTYLISTITNGKHGVSGYAVAMPARGGDPNLTDQDIRDLAAYLIQQNQSGARPALSPTDLARSDVFWVGFGILAMVVLSWLLARYNMRWVGRRARSPRA